MIKIIKDVLDTRAEIFTATEKKVDVSNIVEQIIERVKKEGDSALYDYAEQFDKVKLTSLVVTEQEIDSAMEEVDSEFIEVLKKANLGQWLQ